jgi:hypothetical protein
MPDRPDVAAVSVRGRALLALLLAWAAGLFLGDRLRCCCTQPGK